MAKKVAEAPMTIAMSKEKKKASSSFTAVVFLAFEAPSLKLFCLA